MTRVAGKDASKQFWKYHNESILKKYKKQLQVGSLDSKAKEEAPPTPPATPPAEKKAEHAALNMEKSVEPSAESGTVAPMPTEGMEAYSNSEALDQFGDLVPGADPNWYQTVCSRSCVIAPGPC